MAQECTAAGAEIFASSCALGGLCLEEGAPLQIDQLGHFLKGKQQT